MPIALPQISSRPHMSVRAQQAARRHSRLLAPSVSYWRGQNGPSQLPDYKGSQTWCNTMGTGRYSRSSALIGGDRELAEDYTFYLKAYHGSTGPWGLETIERMVAPLQNTLARERVYTVFRHYSMPGNDCQ